MGTADSTTSVEARLFINRELVPSKSGKTLPITNPHSLKHVADVSKVSVEDVDIAVAATKATYPTLPSLSAKTVRMTPLILFWPSIISSQGETACDSNYHSGLASLRVAMTITIVC